MRDVPVDATILETVNELANRRRVRRLMHAACQAFDLDLTGITVLTEAASGPFVATSLLAALAGSPRVVAWVRDTTYGSVDEVDAYVDRWAKDLGVRSQIEVLERPPSPDVSDIDLVTNVGFVRPIDRAMIATLPAHAAVASMFETWEHRPADVDVPACRDRGIPILGTNESDPRLGTLRFVGTSVVRLLFDADIEVTGDAIVVVGSAPFGPTIADAVRALGGAVTLVDPTAPSWPPADGLADALRHADAVVVAKHRSEQSLVGAEGLDISAIADSGAPVVHLSGVLDEGLLEDHDVRKVPGRLVPARTMTVTTGYAGPRPVIDLHAAGLKVGEALVRGMRATGSAVDAEEFALEHSPAMGFSGAWSR